MAISQDEYPNFPKMTCSICQEKLDIPRGWIQMPFLGRQIILDWESADLLMDTHHKMHNDDLITGVEDFLRAST